MFGRLQFTVIVPQAAENNRIGKKSRKPFKKRVCGALVRVTGLEPARLRNRS